MELAVDGLASGIDQFEGVRAVAVHLAVTVRDASVREQEHGLVGGLRPQRDEIPEHIRVLHTPQTIILLSFNFNTFVSTKYLYIFGKLLLVLVYLTISTVHSRSLVTTMSKCGISEERE